MKLEDILKRAMDWSQENKPESSEYHKAAFANSVSYLVTGYSGGFGGPSIREHICSHALVGDGYNMLQDTNLGQITVSYPDGRLPSPGEWSFDHAINFCSSICFGPLSKYAIKVVEMEYCFNDDPNDLKQLEDWLL